MRIVHITQELSEEGAGVKVAVEALSKEQQKMGHSVQVWGLSNATWKSKDRHKWEGAEAIASRAFGPKSFGFSPYFLCRLLREKIDVLHVHGLWTFANLSALIVAKQRNIRVILSIHGMLAPAALQKSSWKKRIAWFVFQERAIMKADIIHVTSNQEAQLLKNVELKNSPVVLPLGIRITAIEEQIRRSDIRHRILYLGRLAPIKGLERLLTAWSALEQEFSDWQLEIAGPSEENHLNYLMILARELKLRKISFSPALFGEEKLRKMKSADIFVLPSHSENFGLTIAESLSVGVPVVVTKDAPWSGVTKHDCGLWADCEPSKLTEALKTMMNKSDEERKEMGIRGRKWMMKDFSWGVVAECLDSEINKET